MKQIKCEMCGSTDLVKQDGLYVCQSCGCKYTVEEAKKLIIEGPVDVSGSTVKVDTSDELENLYQLARRAKDDNNQENALKYYDMILVKDPTSWEAAFYSLVFKAQGCRIMDIESTAITFANSINSVIELIKEYVNISEQEKTIDEVAGRSIKVGQMLFNGAFNYYKNLNNEIRAQHNLELTNRLIAISSIFANLGDSIDNLFGDNNEYHKYSVMIWKLIIDMLSMQVVQDCNPDVKNVIANYTQKIKSYDISYTNNQPTPTHSSGGCYIATSVYGSYDCPQVWTLRRYRDYVLADSLLGRIFIKTYYAISPTLVKYFGQKKGFRKVWKSLLDRVVRKLKDNGFDDGPYEDKDFNKRARR